METTRCASKLVLWRVVVLGEPICKRLDYQIYVPVTHMRTIMRK